MTQRELSEELGYDYYTFVSQFESGQGRLPEAHYEQMAKLLNVELLDFTKKMLVFHHQHIFKALYGPPTARDLSTEP